MQNLSVGEVARRSGLRPSAVRYYEQAGILPPATRVGGQRRYDGRVFGYLTLIRIAKQVGFTLAETREIARACTLGQPTSRANAMARRKLVELDARIREAQQMRRFLMQLLRGFDTGSTLGGGRGAVDAGRSMSGAAATRRR